MIVVAVVLVAAVTDLVVHQIDQPLPRPVLRASLASSLPVPGAAPALPWPGKGQAAVEVPSLGFAASSGPDTPEPIASLTKMTTAVVVLRDHPVPAGAPGPTITIGAGDVAEYEADAHNDESTVEVRLGEQLSERQVLEGLLTQSANNLAYTLAVWDAGSVAAFVVKMNALAAALGMTVTHYVDASGFDPGTVSSAVDVLKVAAAGMAVPTFAEVVGLSSVTLPLVGTVPNVVTQIGSNGVVGVKSGYTSSAGGCMVLAAYRTVAGRSLLVLASVTGQPTPPPVPPPTTTTTTTTTAPGSPPTAPPPPTTTTTIPMSDWEVVDPEKYAGPTAEALLAAAQASLVPVQVATGGAVVATAVATWGGVAHPVSVATTATVQLPAWPGQTVAVMHVLSVPVGARRGDRVGAVLYSLGAERALVGLHLDQTVQEPSWWWRLTHEEGPA